MQKIKDRIMLGVLTGLAGNVVKLSITKVAKKLGWADIDGPVKAAGMIVPTYKTATSGGMAVGYITDSIIAAILGITTVYLLSFTGKDKAALKGAFSGQAMWGILYGMLSTMGATKISPVYPRTALTEFVAHTAYGATATTVAALLGDPSLFTGNISSNANQKSLEPPQPEIKYKPRS